MKPKARVALTLSLLLMLLSVVGADAAKPPRGVTVGTWEHCVVDTTSGPQLEVWAVDVNVDGLSRFELQMDVAQYGPDALGNPPQDLPGMVNAQVTGRREPFTVGWAAGSSDLEIGRQYIATIHLFGYDSDKSLWDVAESNQMIFTAGTAQDCSPTALSASKRSGKNATN